MIDGDGITLLPLGWFFLALFTGTVGGLVLYWLLRVAIRWEIAVLGDRLSRHDERIRDVEAHIHSQVVLERERRRQQ